jgi:ATPase subunit of ABC transporter with duplicated ATPase domains
VLWLRFLSSFQNGDCGEPTATSSTPCATALADLDFGKIRCTPATTRSGASSQLVLRQRQDRNRDRRESSRRFVRRFSTNASKVEADTSRRNCCKKLTLEDIKPSSRAATVHRFKRAGPGNQLLGVDNLSAKIGNQIFKNVRLHPR